MSLTCTHVGCRKIFKHPEQRRRHQKGCAFPKKGKAYAVVGSNGSNQFTCANCKSYVTAFKNNVYRHARTCKGPGASSSEHKTCKTCLKVFPTPSKLKRHFQSCREQEKYCCDKCSKEFSRLDDFEEHIMSCYTYNEATTPVDDPIPTMITSSPSVNQTIGTLDTSLLAEDEEESELLDIIMESMLPPESNSTKTPTNEDGTTPVRYQQRAAPSTSRKEAVESLQTTIVEEEELELLNIVMRSRLGVCLVSDLKSMFVTGRKQCDVKGLCEALVRIVGIDQLDYDFCVWLTGQLDLKEPWRFYSRLSDWIRMKFSDPRGRPTSYTPEICNLIYNEWMESSVVSTDSHNNRGEVRISQAAYNENYGKFGIKIHGDIVPFTSNRGIPMYKCSRRVTTKTYSTMQQHLETKHGLKISRGTLCALRPFCCVVPTDREKSLCMCKVCLNTRQLFDAIVECCKKQNLSYVPKSITEHFMKNCVCDSKDSNGYYQLTCIKGMCPTGFGKLPDILFTDPEQSVSYYQYELVTSNYTVKRGKNKGTVKETVRTERVTYNETVTEAVQKLNSVRDKYLMHRYLFQDDKLHWPTIMSKAASDAPLFHMDYSENI